MPHISEYIISGIAEPRTVMTTVSVSSIAEPSPLYMSGICTSTPYSTSGIAPEHRAKGSKRERYSRGEHRGRHISISGIVEHRRAEGTEAQ